ncbi:hypothetical protein HPP92_002483 [Vanilla planifolia]|uniref:F-box protein n=1 Tax=Vanilla planifolia TaxID=51239 RepID=A0A835S9V0_VANPL|nr:hypothetical protein HPP92_002483 [Vanilla planifolia]
MRRARDAQSEALLPSKRKGKGAGEPILKTKKRGRTISSCTSPRVSFLTRHSEFSWYEKDLWTEVAKYLDGRDMVGLAVSCKWFYRLIMEDSIWKHAFLRDLQVPSPSQMSSKWIQLYASAFDGSHSYSFRQKEKHIDWMRIGAFFFESSSAVLTEKLAFPGEIEELGDDCERAIQISGACILRDIRSGIWIAGTMQILDVRHAELFLEEGFRNGSWEFQELGSHRIEKPSKSAAGGVFDYKYVFSPSTAGLLQTSGWVGDPGDWQPRARLSTHAVAVNTNLQPNEGLHVRFHAMRSCGSDDKVVSIRISQQLI